MKLITDTPDGLLGNPNFILLGIVSDSMKDYACLLQLKTGNLYIEEIHWGKNKSMDTATLHQIEDDIEWGRMYQWITLNTTIFSPKKIKTILGRGLYFYRSEYLKHNAPQESKK